MPRQLSPGECLAKARSLTARADAACDYGMMLLFDSLALEWMHLAQLAAQKESLRDEPGA